MNKNKTKKTPPNLSTKELRALKKKWYDKLDATGFDDIERTGRLKSTGYYDEYNAILPNADYTIRSTFTLESYQFYNLLRNFSFSRSITSKIHLNKRNKPLKLRLSRIDKHILRAYGNGQTISAISKHLRRRFKPPKIRTGRKGLPYSVFFVHSHLKRLINLMKTTNWQEE